MNASPYKSCSCWAPWVQCSTCPSWQLLLLRILTPSASLARPLILALSLLGQGSSCRAWGVSRWPSARRRGRVSGPGARVLQAVNSSVGVSHCAAWTWKGGAAAAVLLHESGVGSGPRYMICVRVRFSHGSVFSDSRNVQKRATKSDTSGHCVEWSKCWVGASWELQQRGVREVQQCYVVTHQSIKKVVHFYCLVMHLV